MQQEPQFADMSGVGVHEKVIQVANPYLGANAILVAGAGQGSLEYKLLRHGVEHQRIAAIDYNPAQHKLSEINVTFCDLNGRVPFDDGSFDLVLCTEVIEHLNNPQNLIDELHRVTKSGGHLVLTTPNVHSVMQKLRYLFSDQFGWFFERDFLGSGHIHPIFDWLLKRMIRDKWQIKTYTSQSFHLRLIPYLPAIPMPFHSRFFAQNNIYLLEKRNFHSDRK